MRPSFMEMTTNKIIEKVGRDQAIKPDELVNYISKEMNCSDVFVRNILWGLLADDVIINQDGMFVLGRVAV